MEKVLGSLSGYEQDSCTTASQTTGNRNDSGCWIDEQTRERRLPQNSWKREKVYDIFFSCKFKPFLIALNACKSRVSTLVWILW